MRTLGFAAIVLVCVSVVLASVPVGLAADQVIGKPVLSVSAPNNQVSPGRTTTLDLQIANEGKIQQAGPSAYVDRVTTARATRIEVMSGDSPIQVETGEYPVGTVPTGTVGPIPIEITVPENTPTGTYQLPVRVRYQYTSIVDYGGQNPEYSDSTYNQVQTVTVRVKQAPRFEIVDRHSDVLVGDTGTLSVTLKNVGTQTATDASVAVRSQSSAVGFGNGSPSAEAYVGRWAPGQTRTVNYSVGLAKDAKVREYTLNMSVSYDDPDGIPGRSQPLQTSLRPAGEQHFHLADVTSNVRVGQDGNVSGTVVNDGPGTAHSPVVVLTVDNQLIDTPETEYALDDLAPGESGTFDFDADATDSASPGARQFTFTVRYRNADGDLRTSDDLVARVPVREKRQEFGVDPVVNTVTVGSSGKLVLRVTNAGDRPVTDVSAKLFTKDPLSSSDDEAFVSRLDPGQSQNVTFQISSAGGALAKSYPVSVDFQYDNADGDTVLSDSYRVPVEVTEPEGGGGLPILPVVGVVVVLVVAGYYLYRRRSR